MHPKLSFSTLQHRLSHSQPLTNYINPFIISSHHPTVSPFASIPTRRPITHSSLSTLESGLKYTKLESSKARRTYIPPPRGQYKDIPSLLSSIGRNAESVSSKFKDWNHFFTATSASMNALGITNPNLRKYIIGWREWYKQGYDPHVIEVPKRRKKYLRVRAKVQLIRLKKQGLV